MNEKQKEEALARHVAKKTKRELIDKGSLDSAGRLRGSGTKKDPYKLKSLQDIRKLQRMQLAEAGVVVPDGPGHPAQDLEDDVWEARVNRLQAIIDDPTTTKEEREKAAKALGILMD